MKPFSLRKFLFPFLIVGLLLSLPPIFVESIRQSTISSFTPIWKGILGVKSIFRSKKSKAEIEVAKLKSENHLLKLEVEKLRTLIECKPFLEEWKGDVIPAKVIYRDFANWKSFIWINVGHATNEKMRKKIVAKNSPVIFGKSVVGCVDFIGKNESRVRLITDVKLTPSVRAWRPSLQNSLLQKEEGWYLAKGVVHGTGKVLWRQSANLLKGEGFNTDFSDEKGAKAVTPIESGDLLVTTGMDGVFPPNLRVGKVTKVYPLKEGDVSYEIDATAALANMGELQTVFVIAKIGEHEEPFEMCQTK